MNQDFIRQLNTLMVAAQTRIEQICKEQKSISIFHATGKEEFEEEWSEDIYCAVPDFPFYSKHGDTEYAAVKDIKLENEQVYITGVLKDDSYPDQVTVHLMELNAESSCLLADYLLSLELISS